MAAKGKSALGTGLGVLFGEDDILDSASGGTSTLPISKIEPRAEQPRYVFDEEALQTLSDSIAKHGLIQPIAVRALDNGFYQIIAGERRWRASRMAGLEEVPVVIIDADDKKTAELALIENLQREDLNPIEEAKGYQSLLDDYGLTHEEVAESVGRSRPAITNSLRLLSLAPAVLDLVEKRELSAGHARAVLSISNKALQLEAAKEIIEKGLSVRKAEALCSKISSPKKETPENSEKPFVDYGQEVSDDLSKVLGRKVKFVDGKRVGRIEIEFYGAEDREALINMLRNIK